jgi:hypothetical protein
MIAATHATATTATAVVRRIKRSVSADDKREESAEEQVNMGRPPQPVSHSPLTDW